MAFISIRSIEEQSELEIGSNATIADGRSPIFRAHSSGKEKYKQATQKSQWRLKRRQNGVKPPSKRIQRRVRAKH